MPATEVARSRTRRYGLSGHKKGKHHSELGAEARDDQAPRDTRQQTITKPKKKKRKAGPGRPKGSTLQASGLTPNQERIAQKMLEAELETGLFPASVA